MKRAYLGGVRGYQSAVYRPGAGWSGTGSRGHHGRRPTVLKKRSSLHVSPLAVAYQRRPGIKARVAIVATIATVAAILAIAFVGSAQF